MARIIGGSMEILEVKNLSVKYNEHFALKNVSFKDYIWTYKKRFW